MLKEMERRTQRIKDEITEIEKKIKLVNETKAESASSNEKTED